MSWMKRRRLEGLLEESFRLRKLERYEEALECCDKCLTIEPNYGPALNEKRRVLSEAIWETSLKKHGLR